MENLDRNQNENSDLIEPIIAHIDMNSYFATVEQQDNPEWRGKPVGVCEHLGGIIIAASVEAKKLGIKTGTPVWEARKIYPKIILTKTHPDRYRFYTARFLKVFEDYTDQVQKYSIDEAFLDLTKACNVRVPILLGGKRTLVRVDPWVEAGRIAKEIKTRMKTEVGDWITCSVGISYSKLVAKICSDLQKPDGLVVIRPQDKDSLYSILKLTDIPGIGNRMERSLNKLGVRTLADLRDYPLSRLVAYYGIPGYHLHSMGQLQGSWKEGFSDEVSEPMKSIGHMYTMPQEYRNKRMMKPVLYKLCEMVASRLRVNGMMGDTVHVHIHDPERLCASRGARTGNYLQDGRDIYKEAIALLEQTEFTMDELERQGYLIGVTVAGLIPQVNQPSLFESTKHHANKGRLAQAIDKINDKYEDFTIARVPAFLARDVIRDSVGFGRMKEFKTTFMGAGRGSH